MKFKVGDKVNFLNESGGGVITKIIDSRMVNVEVEGGFEMPVLTSELILDYRAKEIEDIEKEYSLGNSKDISQPAEKVEDSEPDRVTEINPYFQVKEEKGVYLVYEPLDQQWILTGDIDIFIVNNTKYDILYSLFFEEKGDLKGVDYG